MMSFVVVGYALMAIAAVLFSFAGFGLLPPSNANFSGIIALCVAVLLSAICGAVRHRG